MKTQMLRLMAFSTLLKNKDFFTPATRTSIINRVIPKARKSGGLPVYKEKCILHNYTSTNF